MPRTHKPYPSLAPDRGDSLGNAAFSPRNEIPLPAHVQRLPAKLGEDGLGHMTTEPCRILVLWPKHSTLQPLELETKQLLLSQACRAFEGLLDLWSSRDPAQLFFANLIKTAVRPKVALAQSYLEHHRQPIPSVGPVSVYTALQAVMHGAAHRLSAERILRGDPPTVSDALDYDLVDLLRYRDLLLIAADSLTRLSKAELQDDNLGEAALLRAAFPGLMSVIEQSTDVAIVASALPHFLPSIIGWKRIRAIGLPTAEHTKHGHLPNELPSANCLIFHSFLPANCRPPAGPESEQGRFNRLSAAAQTVRDLFQLQNTWLAVDAGAGGDDCQVYLAPRKAELTAVTAELRTRRGQFRIPPPPYGIGGQVPGSAAQPLTLSLETTTRAGLGHFYADPAVALGMHKCEYGYRFDEGWLDPWNRSQAELEEACLSFLKRAAAHTICWRLYDDGEVEDRRGKVSVPAGLKARFETRQINALVAAAARAGLQHRIQRLEVMIPNLKSADQYERIRNELAAALRANSFDGALATRTVVLIPQIEGPEGAAALKALLARDAIDCPVVALGVSDLTQRACGAASRELPELRVFPPAALALIKEVCALAGGVGAEVRAAGHLAQPPGNLALLLGLGIRQIVIPPDYIESVLEITGKVTPADCARLAEQCARWPKLRDRMETVDRLFRFSEVENPIWDEFALQVRSQSDFDY